MTARLLVSCPDRPGVVAALSRFLYARGANIVDSQQHSTDPHDGTFFMRTAFHPEPAGGERGAFAADFAAEVAAPLEMDWQLTYGSEPKRMAILASRHEHCLLDLLWRRRRGELDCRIELVVSNHRDLASDVAAFGVRYEHVPVSAETKPEAEERMLELLAGRTDVVVLARYMQILSGDFLERLGVPVINIHHSFLPAFAGADPYVRARERGVKIIGATAHYVTEELDAGPIIDQDVARVSHRHGLEAMARIGGDIERTVLARAVRWHLADRILVHDGKTVVF